MTPLRQEAFQLLKLTPEEDLFAVIRYLRSKNLKQPSNKQRIATKRVALDELLQLCKPIPELDEKQKLAQYRQEKFGYASAH